MHSMHSTLSHRELQDSLKGRGGHRVGEEEGDKENTNKGKIRWSPLPESIPEHKDKQTYYYLISTGNTAITLDASYMSKFLLICLVYV